MTIDYFSILWYYTDMERAVATTYTPEQVAKILQLNKNTIYDLINRGEIVAKKLGKVYRIPTASLSFVFTGLDYDLFTAEQEDLKNISAIHNTLKDARKTL